MIKILYTTVLCLILQVNIFGQILSPVIFNTTGGYSAIVNNSYYFDWSLGEETVIETRQLLSISLYTHGVLQPEFPNPNNNPGWGQYELRIYPNPVKDQLTLEFSSYHIGPVSLTMFDAAGKLVYTKLLRIPGVRLIEKINTSQFAAGVYALNVHMEQIIPTSIDKYSTYKIVVVK